MVERTVALSGKKLRIIAAMALAVVFVGYTFLSQSTRSEIPDHGDWWTDMAHVIGARNLTLYGFSEVRFGAVSDNGLEVGLPPAYHASRPAFPFLVLGLLYQLGLSTVEARIFPLLVSASALIAIYILAYRIVGDWRAGALAALALAASAPFHLLSDSFANVSYDFAAKTWTVLFITLASLDEGRRRKTWLAAAGVGAFATTGLLSIEMAPAIAAYAVLFPLLLGKPAEQESGRRHLALIAGLSTGFGLLAGLALRLAHNAWLFGSLEVAAANLVTTYFSFSPATLGANWQGGYLPRVTEDYLISYVTLLINRALDYFPIHLAVVLLGIAVAGLLGDNLGGRPAERPIKWLGIIFFSEALWFMLFPQQTSEHAYAVYQLSLTISLATAFAAIILWRAVGSSSLGRAAVATTGAAVLVASMANLGVQPRGGNLQVQLDWSWQRQQVELLAELIPANAVVVLDVGNMGPAPEFFLKRSYVRRWSVDHLDDSKGRPWFLMTRPRSDNEVYRDAWVTGRLMKTTQELAVIDMNSNPSPASQVTAGARSP